ncbi:MAG: ATP-binding cassette domain-containing protein [Phycisphaerales bacterium]|nr:MAG: ATP-binding cassette domain-containing protein [Phycisphaerales bacterium]
MGDPKGNARPVVACQRLTKTFKDFWMRDRARAVDGVDFEIRPREIFGLLGPNGSGKSTTIKMILGLLRPTSGRLAVFGKPANDVSIKKRIGYLPEESYLYPFLNARETLDYYAKLFEIDARTRTRRIDELLDMVGLTAAQHRPVREYSKGMQRRIGLAQALINDPDLLILDEPTTGLDPLGTRQVKDLILELGRRGKTVLLSSHLLADVEDCVDRMVILYGGKIRSAGNASELLVRQGRTTIETEDLDDATIAAIDTLIRERTGGTRELIKVSRPRQKLEELFLDIVEKAKAERLETSGATSGGQTAEFLRSGERDGEDGAALIDRLVAESVEPMPEDGEASDRESASKPPESEPTAALAGLVDTGEGSEAERAERTELEAEDEAAREASPSEASPRSDAPSSSTAPKAPPASEDVDLGVIGSLLGEDPDEDEGKPDGVARDADGAPPRGGPTDDDARRGPGGGS